MTPAQDWRAQQRKFLTNYYGFLAGARCVETTIRESDGESWPVLTFEKQHAGGPITIDDKEYAPGETIRFEVEVSRDEEGNGPGFLFGLPMLEASS